MTLQEIIQRNYSATVKRGLIKPETTDFDFVEKLEHETIELSNDLKHFHISKKSCRMEMADCALVLFAMAKHFDIELLKAMEEKVIYNEQRKD